MSNNSRINPMYVDTASSSRLVSDSTSLMINNIAVVASNATWSCILKNGAGSIVYSASNIAGVPSAFTVPFLTTGLVVDTLTACTLLIYTTPA
jgi:hypothetical protein